MLAVCILEIRRRKHRDGVQDLGRDAGWWGSYKQKSMLDKRTTLENGQSGKIREIRGVQDP